MASEPGVGAEANAADGNDRAPFGRDGTAWRTAWEALRQHHEAVADVHMRDLFAADPRRFERFSMIIDGGAEAPAAAVGNDAARAELLIDLSKHRATDETFRLLLEHSVFQVCQVGCQVVFRIKKEKKISFHFNN